MDGIARVTVDKYVMEYVMHCMYDTFLKIQKVRALNGESLLSVVL